MGQCVCMAICIMYVCVCVLYATTYVCMYVRTYIQGLSVVALQCLCELAVALSHFNYRSNILAVLVPQMDSSALKGEVHVRVCRSNNNYVQTC